MIAGVLAAFAYSTMPIAIWYADAGRIDHHVFVALLFAANVVVMAQIFACGRFESERTNCDAGALDATLGGLTGGAIAGIALLSWLASALFMPQLQAQAGLWQRLPGQLKAVAPQRLSMLQPRLLCQQPGPGALQVVAGL